jgi:hypothetical protein
VKKALEVLREMRERDPSSTPGDRERYPQRSQSSQFPKSELRRRPSPLDVGDLLPRSGEIDVAALREVADADATRWRELTALDLELDRLERAHLEGTPAWDFSLSRFRWVLVGVLQEYAHVISGRAENEGDA